MYNLKTCPFCGGNAELVLRNPEYYGTVGAFVRCISCDASTRIFGISETLIAEGSVSTKINRKTIWRGGQDAIRAWNGRKS